ncbi:MAG: hypothetical protein FWB91_02360 [Defluviitaleaceae bacterium]|nr:hypothetical protein [Defluviitaleaceae bacterium]
MSHAYIFEGEGREAALNFAKGLNCVLSESSPCGECLSCRTFDSFNHPDTIFVSGTKQKGIGVGDVREQVLMPMAHKPFKYKYKVFIVDKAETLTPAAQNALLKTIEEPAPYGFFLFIAAHSFNFLPTMLSRCVLKKVRGGNGFSPHAPDLESLAEDIAAKAEGADIYDAFALYRLFESLSKDSVPQVLDILYGIYGQKISRAAKAGQAPQETWFNAVAAITKTKKILAGNGNAQLAIELMLNEMR